jgi:hypothetical protein
MLKGPKLEIFVAEFFLHNPSLYGYIDDLGTKGNKFNFFMFGALCFSFYWRQRLK